MSVTAHNGMDSKKPQSSMVVIISAGRTVCCGEPKPAEPIIVEIVPCTILNKASISSIPYITTSNLYWDHFELNSLKEMPFTESEIEKCTVTKGDLLVCEGGDVGRSAIWMFDKDIRIQNHIHRLRPYISLSNRFYYYVMFMWKQMGFIGGQGIGLQGFSSKALHNLLVPLPPEEEQIKIAAFVDNLFETITNIEKSLS